MKKLSKITGVFAIEITIVSCNKEELTTPNQMNDSRINYTLDQIPILENVQNTQELLSLTDDQDDEKIFGYCYEIGLATRELVQDSKFVTTMIGLAKKNLSLEYITENMTHRPILPNPKFPETAEIERYEPAIFIPNLKQVDREKQALISPKVVTDGDLNPELEDYIVTWYYTESGELQEILVREETSLKTTNPLFIIDNAERFEKNALVLGHNFNPESPRDEVGSGDRAIIRFDSKELKIQNGYRYESTAASEYSIIGYRIEGNPSGNGIPHWVYNSNGWKVITDISSSQIGQTVVAQSLHANVWTPYANNRFFWNTFERDWYSSPKDLGNASFDGTTIYLVGERQNTSEWFDWETSVNFASWKADYVVHKIE